MLRSPITACSIVLLTVVGASAETQGTAPNDAGPIASAKVSLESAVGIAEKHAKGKAIRAEYEKKDGSWVYDVEVKADNGVTDVKVDPEKGTIVASAADQADEGDDNDKAD
jgi:uncharacterized membrane protein YkoI